MFTDTLSREEAIRKNQETPMSTRIQFAVHELTHHLIAEHYGLVCGGIELGFQEGRSPYLPAMCHTGDELERKFKAGEPITPEYNRAYAHAVLSNGYGDEAVFGTPPELRGAELDEYQARKQLERFMHYEPHEAQAFMDASIKETRRILSDPKIRQSLRSAGELAAREYWGTGKLMSRDAVNEALNKKGGS
jgi:hypothetical protein